MKEQLDYETKGELLSLLSKHYLDDNDEEILNGLIHEDSHLKKEAKKAKDRGDINEVKRILNKSAYIKKIKTEYNAAKKEMLAFPFAESTIEKLTRKAREKTLETRPQMRSYEEEKRLHRTERQDELLKLIDKEYLDPDDRRRLNQIIAADENIKDGSSVEDLLESDYVAELRKKKRALSWERKEKLAEEYKNYQKEFEDEVKARLERYKITYFFKRKNIIKEMKKAIYEKYPLDVEGNFVGRREMVNEKIKKRVNAALRKKGHPEPYLVESTDIFDVEQPPKKPKTPGFAHTAVGKGQYPLECSTDPIMKLICEYMKPEAFDEISTTMVKLMDAHPDEKVPEFLKDTVPKQKEKRVLFEYPEAVDKLIPTSIIDSIERYMKSGESYELEASFGTFLYDGKGPFISGARSALSFEYVLNRMKEMYGDPVREYTTVDSMEKSFVRRITNLDTGKVTLQRKERARDKIAIVPYGIRISMSRETEIKELEEELRAMTAIELRKYVKLHNIPTKSTTAEKMIADILAYTKNSRSKEEIEREGLTDYVYQFEEDWQRFVLAKAGMKGTKEKEVLGTRRIRYRYTFDLFRNKVDLTQVREEKYDTHSSEPEVSNSYEIEIERVPLELSTLDMEDLRNIYLRNEKVEPKKGMSREKIITKILEYRNSEFQLRRRVAGFVNTIREVLFYTQNQPRPTPLPVEEIYDPDSRDEALRFLVSKQQAMSVSSLHNMLSKRVIKDPTRLVSGYRVQPENLKRNTLLNHSDFQMSWKYDGQRMTLILSKEGIFLCSPPYFISRIGDGVDMNLTILDCEYMSVDSSLHCFDIMFNKGVDVRGVVFEDRKQMMDELDLDSINTYGMKMFTKSFYKGNVYTLAKRLLSKAPTYKIDGLILQVDGTFYFNKTTYKWKPPADLTIDFLYRRRVEEVDEEVPKDSVVYDILVNDNREMVPFVYNSSKGYTILRKDNLPDFPLEEMIVESRWDGNQFIPVHHRYDKTLPNAMQTAKSVFQDILQPISRDTIEGRDLVIMRRFHNMVKKNMINAHVRKGGTIIDVGSGRGGDIAKWMEKELKVYAIEPDKKNIKIMKERIEGKDYPITILNTGIEKTASIEKKIGNIKVDSIVSFFSLTFLMKNDIVYEGLLITLEKFIARGGTFVGIVLDAERTKNLLKTGGEELVYEDEDSDEEEDSDDEDKEYPSYETEAFTISQMTPFTRDTDDEDMFGQKIHTVINDPDSMVDTDEYLFYFELFAEDMRRRGFELTLDEFIDRGDHYDNLPEAAKTFSGLNRKFVFTRRG